MAGARGRKAEASEQRLKSVKAGPLVVLAELQPSIMNCLDAQMRLDRRVAALRVVEAIRLYAASHDGKLPEELNQVTEVPVPEDPATGKPFEYRRDGAASVLALPDAGMKGRPIPPYRITIRKRTDGLSPEHQEPAARSWAPERHNPAGRPTFPCRRCWAVPADCGMDRRSTPACNQLAAFLFSARRRLPDDTACWL